MLIDKRISGFVIDTLLAFLAFVGAVHILYWPCTVLMGRYYPLPTKLFLTSSIILFVMLVSWRLLFQLSSSVVTSHDVSL